MKKKSSENKIFLEDFCTRLGNKAAKVFTGRDRGEEVRLASNIDAIFKQYHHIEIDIPQGTFSITPSFLEEFFVNIVSDYGLDDFRENVSINSNGYQIDTPLEEAIERIMQRNNALQK